MGLKEKWVDKVDGVDYVLAKDINNIANAVIDLEQAVGEFDLFLDELHNYAQTLARGGDGE
jgi:hypothetical protein